MDIQLKEITVRQLTQQYFDNQEKGIVGFGGRLDIRPPYQREFVYNEKQRAAVVDTVRKGFPLNIMYWATQDEEDVAVPNYEIIDGQQRTISICQYVNGDFSVNEMYFHNLEQDRKDEILNYELAVYICDGTDSEKLDWFRTINIAGEELTEQELRNAVYHGSWLSDAKKHFSRTGCVAHGLGSDYLRGSAIRQDYLETTLKWISDDSIEEYMGKHQLNEDANELWQYFQKVIAWVKITFPTYRREMKGLNWGELYNGHKDTTYNSSDLEKRAKTLMMDDDVTKKKGIYEYLLTDNEKYLNIRSFTAQQKREVFERQDGICPACGEEFELKKMEADHITPWSQGGKTESDNCQMLCRDCNRRKSDT